MDENSSNLLQDKCRKRLQALMPQINIRVSGDALLFNKKLLNEEDLNYLSMVDGMYQGINIKRSGNGVVVILIF